MSNTSALKLHACTFVGCNAAYSKNWKLIVHQRKHNGERPFVCDIPDCGKTYTQVAHLKRHKSYTHEKSEELLCKVEGCGRVLNNAYSLKKHLSRQHNPKPFPFTCEECSTSFKKKKQYQMHIRIHTGESSFRCNYCPSLFFTTEYLFKKHMANHKTYTCDCGEIFPRWSLIVLHKRTVCSIKKVHKCVICNKTFSTSSNLTQHALVHLEESKKETYNCPYLNCSRSYKYKKNLTGHIKVFHEKLTEDVKFACPDPKCSTILKSKKNLKQHVRSFHSGLPKKIRKRKTRKDKGLKGKLKAIMGSALSGFQIPPKERSPAINKKFGDSSDSKDNNTLNVVTDIDLLKKCDEVLNTLQDKIQEINSIGNRRSSLSDAD